MNYFVHHNYIISSKPVLNQNSQSIRICLSGLKYLLWLCRHRIALIGYVVSEAVLCVWAEFIMLATNRTEAVVNESRAELHTHKEVELRSCRESNV